MTNSWRYAVLAAISGLLGAGDTRAVERNEKSPSRDAAGVRSESGDAGRGYELLTTKAYLPAVFNQANVDEIWRAWPQTLRKRAEEADAETRRRLIFERYGFTDRVDFKTGLSDGSGKPLQYVVDEQGRWSMNCLACHGGSVMGKSYPGAPNNRFAFELLAKEMRTSKLQRGIPPNEFDVGSLLMPLGRTRGTTNAIMFGVGLMHYRDEDLNLKRGILPPAFIHHDVDAPAWWTFRKKSRLYIDGFAQKGHRSLLQFVMVKENSGERLRSWESEFKDIYAYLTSIETPKYPYSVDLQVAQRGAKVFESHCAECHGSYRRSASPNHLDSYSEYRVPIEQIGTDPVRLRALKPKGRSNYARGWLADYGQQDTVIEPDGYVAPPLDGVWATAPYFHNGSVPTLWGVLNPEERPQVWKHQMELDGEIDNNFDVQEVGLLYAHVSEDEAANGDAHEIFDTRKFGKSSQGHTFPDVLKKTEKIELLEYLKTL